MVRADGMDGIRTRQKVSRYVGRLLGQPWPAHAWPGGYAIAYLADDAETVCAACMNREDLPIHFGGDDDGWKIVGAMAFGADTDYPDSDEVCAHCGAVIQHREV